MNAATTPWLETPSVILRPLELGDAEALFAAHGDEQTHRFWSAPAHRNVAETRTYIEDTLKTGRAWAITESGVIMRRNSQGRGLATRALMLVCDYAFSQLGMHRIQVNHIG